MVLFSQRRTRAGQNIDRVEKTFRTRGTRMNEILDYGLTVTCLIIAIAIDLVLIVALMIWE